MLQIGLDFVDPFDEDVPTNEEQRLRYSDDKLEEEGDVGDDLDSRYDDNRI